MSLSAYIQGIRKVKIGTYNLSPIAIFNGGDVPDTTDWEGLPGVLSEGWINLMPWPEIASLVSGNGFIGYAFKSDGTFYSTNSYFGTNSETHPLKENIIDSTYVISLKYRASGAFLVYFYGVEQGTGHDIPSDIIGVFPANTGNAVHMTKRRKFVASNMELDELAQSIVFVQGPDFWLEIDEVRLYRLDNRRYISIQRVTEVGSTSYLIRGETTAAMVQLQIMTATGWEDYGDSQTGSVYLSYTQPPKRDEFRVKAWNVSGDYFYSNIFTAANYD